MKAAPPMMVISASAKIASERSERAAISDEQRIGMLADSPQTALHGQADLECLASLQRSAMRPSDQ
ncbi:MAG: hypothetical protein R3C97_16455 [Geminicoccaceae bacterium]